jgi:hypothetical protein
MSLRGLNYLPAKNAASAAPNFIKPLGLKSLSEKNAASAAPNFIKPLGTIHNPAERSLNQSPSGFQNPPSSSRNYPSDGRLDGD